LQAQVSKYRPGNSIKVTVLRDSKERVFNVTLRNKDGNMELSKKRDPATKDVFGAFLAAAHKTELNELDLDHGVKVVRIKNGKLRSSGIREGFIITKIDKQEIIAPEDINRVLSDKKGGVLIEGVYPNGMKAYYGYGI